MHKQSGAKATSRLWRKAMVAILLVVVMTVAFYSNCFMPGNRELYNSFFRWNASEPIVVDKIMSDKASPDNMGVGSFGLGWYKSCFGLQGHAFSFLYNSLHIASVEVLHLLCCIALSAVLLSISWLLWHRYTLLLGTIFYMTCLFSPWVGAMSGNLYWVEFTFFLPTLFSLLQLRALRTGRKKRVWIYCSLVFVASLVKSLCGYEFISSIMFFAVAFPIAELLTERDSPMRKKLFGSTVATGMSLMAGFVCAMLLHAVLRGNGSISAGVKSIWENDVLRRTLGGNIDKFADVFRDSLLATPLDVLKKYIFEFSSDIAFGIPGKLFPVLLVLSFMVLVFQTIKSRRLFSFDNVTFLMLFLTPISWFVLGKAHSYIHTHINFILWYLGFIPFCFYVIAQPIMERVKFAVIQAKIQSLSTRVTAILCLVIAFAVLLCAYRSPVMTEKRNNLRELLSAQAQGELLYASDHASIYRYNNALYYIVSPSGRFDGMFFLRTYPLSMVDMPQEQRETGFVQLDFVMDQQTLPIPSWRPSDSHVAKVELPPYSCVRIDAGQTLPHDDDAVVWGTSIELSLVQTISLQCASLIDANWIRGTSTTDPLLLIARTVSTDALLAKAHAIQSGDVIKRIESVTEVDANWMHVRLEDAHDLDAFAYPRQMELIFETP